MSINNQETYWNYTSGSSTGLPDQSIRDKKWQTSGSSSSIGDFEFSSLLNKPDVTLQARKILSSIENDEVRINAENLLIIIRTILDNYFEISELPPLRAFQSQDGSLIFEWGFPHFRVGFGIEQDISESGWYLVSDDNAGNITASGKILGDSGTESIVIWLLQYISMNY